MRCGSGIPQIYMRENRSPVLLRSKKIIQEAVECRKADGKILFASASSQTQSVPLLHLLSKIASDVPILFLDTGYHFPETCDFLRALKNLFSLKVISLRA